MAHMPTSVFNQVSTVCDYLLLSGYGAVTPQNIEKFKVTCVVDATNIPQNRQKMGDREVDYLRVPVEDSEWARIESHLEPAADKIEEHRLKNGVVLVHCAAGISRSTTVCLAYLIKHQNMTLREAYLLCRQARPIVSPNTGFWRQLIEYEKRLRGENSVEMLKGRFGGREVPDVWLTERNVPIARSVLNKTAQP